MNFIEFKSVFVEKEAPTVKSFCRLEAVDFVEINTAGDDTDNTGDYFVWLSLRGGEKAPCFRGTLEACKKCYEMIICDMKRIYHVNQNSEIVLSME